MKTSNRWASGYTIIEVMIFLAVSGLMFVIAAVFISGKQAQVNYQQGMQAAGSTVTNVINSVINGEYPALPNGQQCSASNGTISFSPSGTTSQGNNQGCTFIGKVLQFGTGGSGAQYKTFTVVGLQFASSGNDPLAPIQNLAGADPTVITSPVQTGMLENGLSFSQADLCTGTCGGGPGNGKTSISGVGLFEGFGNSSGTGAQPVSAWAITGTTSTELAASTPLSGGNYAVLCFDYGNKPGSVVIGGQNGQAISVRVNQNGGQQPC